LSYSLCQIGIKDWVTAYVKLVLRTGLLLISVWN